MIKLKDASPEKFNFSTELRVRLPETDAMGIVFHSNFFVYMDVARVDYLRNLGLGEAIRPIKGFSNVVAHVSCDFVSPAKFNDVLIIKARIAEIGHTSLRFEFLIYHKRENRLVARGQSIHVAIDEETWKPIPIPEEFRQIIRKYEGRELVERG